MGLPVETIMDLPRIATRPVPDASDRLLFRITNNTDYNWSIQIRYGDGTIFITSLFDREYKEIIPSEHYNGNGQGEAEWVRTIWFINTEPSPVKYIRVTMYLEQECTVTAYEILHYMDDEGNGGMKMSMVNDGVYDIDLYSVVFI